MFLDFLQKKSSATALESPVSEPKVELPVPAPTILPFPPFRKPSNGYFGNCAKRLMQTSDRRV